MRTKSKAILVGAVLITGAGAFTAGVLSSEQKEEILDDWGTEVQISKSPLSEEFITGTPIVVKPFKECKIGALGVHPWATHNEVWTEERKFATVQALQIAGIPENLRPEFSKLIQENVKPNMIRMTNLGGTDNQGKTYSNKFDMSYKSKANGYVMCNESRLAFPNDERETWCLAWTISNHTVGYCLACENLTRFYPGPLAKSEEKGKAAGPTMNKMPAPESGITELKRTDGDSLRRTRWRSLRAFG